MGRTFNVTRERIRQIENDSLTKLRYIDETQMLRNDDESSFTPSAGPLGHRT